tara:strand:- start:253 stop:453 length:201 start_codon:yes stop_codon:yes gene_type:complete
VRFAETLCKRCGAKRCGAKRSAARKAENDDFSEGHRGAKPSAARKAENDAALSQGLNFDALAQANK